MKSNAAKKEITASRRRYPRFTVDVQAKVTVAEQHYSAHTRDISRAGLCLVSMESLPRHADLAVELVLTFGEGGMSEPLHVLGTVVWCTALFGAYQIGVKFVKVDEDQARYLNMFLGFLDGSLSTGDAFGEDDEPTGRPSDPDDPFAA
jgi:c-di-GMP-binding flagellar brake protein YcgR